MQRLRRLQGRPCAPLPGGPHSQQCQPLPGLKCLYLSLEYHTILDMGEYVTLDLAVGLQHRSTLLSWLLRILRTSYLAAIGTSGSEQTFPQSIHPLDCCLGVPDQPRAPGCLHPVQTWRDPELCSMPVAQTPRTTACSSPQAQGLLRARPGEAAGVSGRSAAVPGAGHQKESARSRQPAPSTARAMPHKTGGRDG